MNSLFSGFDDSGEEKCVNNRRKRFYSEIWETPFEGGGACKKC